MKLVINSQGKLPETFSQLTTLFNEFKYVRLTVTTKRDRTLDQNALWAAMYQRISESLGDGTAADIADVRGYCKLMLGVPILRRDDEQFEKGWRRYFAAKNYEEQVYLMGNNALFGVDGFPVTRLLNTQQGAEYTNEIVRHYAPYSVLFGDLLDGN